MSIWLRYLAVAVLIGNAFTALWNLIPLARSIPLGSVGLVGFNLAVSFAAIALAVLVAAPARQGVGLGAKLIAGPAALGGGFGILSSTLWLHAQMGQPHTRLPTDVRDVLVEAFTM